MSVPDDPAAAGRDDQAAAGGPERDVARRRVEDCNGNYYREPGDDGRWLYFWGEPVPDARDVYDEGGRLAGLMAPELAPCRLLDAKAVSRLCGWGVGERGRRSTLSTHLSNGRMVRPVVTIGTGNGWSLPIVEWFLAHRPFRAPDWYDQAR
jgi:hypothetical protein